MPNVHHRDATSLTSQWKKGLFNCHQEKNEISLHFLEIVSRFLFVSLQIFLYQVRKYINQVPLVGSVKVPWVDAFLREIVKVMHYIRLQSVAPPAS